MSPEYKRAFVLLLLGTAIVLAAGLGLRDPWPADEPRFALIARDMAESGSWLIPYIGGVPYPDKPPLHFWLVAALQAITGSLRFSFLLPAFVGGIVIIALVADLGRRLWDERSGIWCGAVLLTMLQFPLQMKSGQLDGPVCVWTTLSLYGFCRHILLGPDWRWYAVGGLAAGLGVITKGVGFLPYLVFLPLLLAVRGNWSPRPFLARDWRWILAPAFTVLAVSAWLIPMLLATSVSADPALQAYRDNILFHQTVTRYANAWGHIKPPWYLWTNAVTWLWLPAILALPWLLPAWWRDLKAHRNTPVLLLGGWVLLVLLFFSFSAGKRSVYIFPAAPAFALIVGACAGDLTQRPAVRAIARALPIVFGIALVAAGMYGWRNPGNVGANLPDESVVLNGTIALAAIGIAMVLVAALVSRRRPFFGAAASMAMMWIGFGMVLAPTIDGIRSGRDLMRAAEAAVLPGQSLGIVDWPEQFLLQAQRPVFHFGFRRDPEADFRDAVAWLGGDDTRRVLVPRVQALDCVSDGTAVDLGSAHRRVWWIIGFADLSQDCRAGAASGPGSLYRYAPGTGRGEALAATG
jgi:4-amino-4-deoxy-L-arabinose transferase-like glycosyltransferase